MEICVVPRARYMIICDEVLQDEQRPGKLTIVGLTSLVVWPPGAETPMRLERLVVLLVLTDGRGAGMGRVVCVNEETGLPVFGSPAVRISFEGRNPLGHYGVTFKLHDCRFPEPGAYTVQFFFDDTLVQEQLITVR